MSTKSSAASRFAEIVDDPVADYAPVVSQTPSPPSVSPPYERQRGQSSGERSREPVRKHAEKSERASAKPSRIGKVGMQLWVEPTTHRRLKVHAAMTGGNLNDFLNEAVVDFIKKYKIA